jgi:phosphate starvation-inducible PhoH-like protein
MKKPEIDFAPKTQVQSELFHDLDNNSLIVALGPAGTGKTFTCCTKAAIWLVRGCIQKIVLARANVSTGKSLGAIPGTLEEKLEPWMLPMTDILRQHLQNGFYEYCVRKDKIEVVSLETIRGRSFDHAMILVDEAQQLTLDELKAITTRVGEGSVLVLMGDPKQTDIANKSGLMQFVDLLQRYNPEECSVLEFMMEDIVRSNICANMVRMFYKAGL